METVKTRILILSDTHGVDFSQADRPDHHVDVAIHCGDLTDGSKLEEYKTAIKTLTAINAPLKLVIAGNHDFTLDDSAFDRIVAEAMPPLDPRLVALEYGASGTARQLLEDARKAGIIYLTEGTRSFSLKNGAHLKVYSSPCTPSYGAWGFQYRPDQGHDFDIESNTDIVITHGPPKGVMDYTHGRERAGCPDLFRSVAVTRPLIHCFGHIHEGWGARFVSWRDDIDVEKLSHFTAIDNNASAVLEKLSGLQSSQYDSPEDAQEKQLKLKRQSEDKCYTTSHCQGDDYPLTRGENTLFVNASITSSDPVKQRPCLVDIELPVSRQ